MNEKKSDDSSAQVISKERRKRINRLKKIIVILVICAILIPMILCVFLLVKVGRLEDKVKRLEQTRETFETQLTYQQESPVMNMTAALQELPADEGAADLTGKTFRETGQENTDSSGDPDLLSVGNPEEADQTETAGNDPAEFDGIRRVYLTFDDGPSSNTQRILDILDSYGVKATFFVVGKTDSNSIEMYQKIVEQGHTLGMHSYSHKYKDLYSSVEAFTEDLNKIQDYLLGITGVTCTFYRFPGGSSNSVSDVDMQELIAVLQENDITYFDWNASSGDGENRLLSVDELVDNVITGAEDYRNMVILMHDAADKSTTVDALPIIIEQLLALPDTEILPITEETVLVQHVRAE